MVDTVKHKAQRSDSSNTPLVRGAYPYCFVKRTKRANGKPLTSPRWDVTLLAPKLHADATQCANYAYLAAHCMQAASREPLWGGWPQGGFWPIQDGDQEVKPKAAAPGQPAVPFDPNKYAWRKGNWIFEATTNLDPGPKVAVMINGQVTEIPAQTINGKQMFKSGDYCIVSLHAYTFENEKFGVNFGFEGILWMREGEAIGQSGQRSAASMFGGIAPMAAPGAGGPPIPRAAAPAPQPQYAAPAAPQPQYAAPAPALAAAPAYAPSPGYAPPPGVPGLPPLPAPPPAAPALPGSLPPFPGPR